MHVSENINFLIICTAYFIHICTMYNIRISHKCLFCELHICLDYTCREFIRRVTVFRWQFSLNRLPGYRCPWPHKPPPWRSWPTRFLLRVYKSNWSSRSPRSSSLDLKLRLTTLWLYAVKMYPSSLFLLLISHQPLWCIPQRLLYFLILPENLKEKEGFIFHLIPILRIILKLECNRYYTYHLIAYNL